MSKIDHKGRLAGWTENQIDLFYHVAKRNTSKRPMNQREANNRVRNTLLNRNVIMRLNGTLLLTEYGEAVARSCGWLPLLRKTEDFS